MEVILRISLLCFSNIDAEFVKRLKKLIWKSYTTTEALLTIGQIELIDKREFARAIFNKNSKIYFIYILALEVSTIYLYSTIHIADL